MKLLGRLSRCGALLLALVLSGCGMLERSVARSVDGVTTQGRFIEPDAYALYTVAALHEARGRLHEALASYERALTFDGRGPEIRTRIGAVACKLRRDTAADRAFSDALSRDPSYGPAWFELSLCRKARGQLESAIQAARQAVRLDPENYQASLVWADLEELRGNRTRAFRVRDALATHASSSRLVQQGLLEAAKRAGDEARSMRARAALSRLNPADNVGRPPSAIARALAALQRGDSRLARQEAEQVLSADPSNGDALVLALAAMDLEQDRAGFSRLLAAVDAEGTPASSEVLVVLEALLARRVSAQAAQLVRPRP